MKKNLVILCSILLYIAVNVTHAQNNGSYKPIEGTKTPNNSKVSDCWVFDGKEKIWTEAQLATIQDELDSLYSGAILVSQPSEKYNCHAYAWHIVEGGNELWMGSSEGMFPNGYTNPTYLYWTDGSYEEVPEAMATKVAYDNEGNHSAIRLDSVWYQSKWGADALVKHQPDNLPPQFNRDPSKKKFYRLAVPRPICTSTIILTDQLVITDTTITSKCDTYIENVTVSNQVKITINEKNTITLQSSAWHGRYIPSCYPYWKAGSHKRQQGLARVQKCRCCPDARTVQPARRPNTAFSPSYYQARRFHL